MMTDEVKQSFSIQAERFESKDMSFSKKEYLDHTVREMELTKTPNEKREKIIRLMMQEMEGGGQTGFAPISGTERFSLTSGGCFCWG